MNDSSPLGSGRAAPLPDGEHRSSDPSEKSATATKHAANGASSASGDATDPWLDFLEPASGSAYLAGWLAVACGRIAGTDAGILFLRGEGNRIGIAASWRMADQKGKSFEEVAEALARNPEPLVKPHGQGALLGYPIELNGTIEAIAVLALKRHPGPRLRDVLRDLHWATGWIETQLWHGRAALSEKQIAAARLALDLLAAADQNERFDASALALVNAIGDLTGFDRGAIGMVRGKRVRLEALSRAAVFKKKADLVAELEAAMDEAVAQNDVVMVPRGESRRSRIDLAHRRLMERSGSGAVITAPLVVRGKAVGALLLERGRAEGETVTVDADAIDHLRLAAAAIAPVLKLKHDERRWWSGRLRHLMHRAGSAVLGRRPALTLATIAVLVLAVLPFLITGELRVSAQATLQGREQRAAVAPVDGFLRESQVRAGDSVQRGDVIATLDDRDLRLQQSQSLAKSQQAGQAARDALATGDRAASAKASAELAEAMASLALIDAQLDRLEVSAPMDGIIVSGDLSQKLGAPVSQGEVLFEIARLDGFRVLVDVSEYDLSLIALGQTGEVVLTSLSARTVPIRVTGISAVSEPADGENRFRVEAQVVGLPERARPGMEGVAKISAGRASLAWIWLRGTVNRLRLMFWRFMPWQIPSPVRTGIALPNQDRGSDAMWPFAVTSIWTAPGMCLPTRREARFIV